MTFGVVVGDLGKGFCRRDTDRNGNAGVTPHPGFQFPAFGKALFFVTSRQFEKGFIDGIAFHLGNRCFEGVHHPIAHVPVKRVVRGKDVYLLAAQLLLDLKNRGPHRDSQRLRFVGPRDDAAVVVGKHHHRPVFQFRAENTFTGNVEVVAVGERKHQTSRMMWVTTPQIEKSESTRIGMLSNSGFSATRKIPSSSWTRRLTVNSPLRVAITTRWLRFSMDRSTISRSWS